MFQTVFSKPHAGPVTRAIVIGVGHYPALPGGGGHSMAHPEGLRQLHSPPTSARAMAQWLIESYHSPTRPLASVQLLISEAVPQDFTFNRDGQAHVTQSQPASLVNVRQAIRDWYTSSTDTNDLMLFYFCGHGLADGANLALLMSDFGTVPTAPLDGAMNFTAFRMGMESCQAREQCFFVDACRLSSTLLQRNPGQAGDPIIQKSLDPVPGGRPRIGPQFFSTLDGEAAYGRANAPSVFTEALLEAMGGCGAEDIDGQRWTVQTGTLQKALEFLIDDAVRTHKWPIGQRPIVDGMQSMDLNTLKGVPRVPVLIHVDPQLAHEEAKLRYDGAYGQDQRDADPQPWRTHLQPGLYNFHASFPSARYADVTMPDSLITPPFKRRTLKAEAK